MQAVLREFRDFFRMGPVDYASVEALSSVLVRDLKSRLVIEFGLAILFASVGEYLLATVWILTIVPAEYSEIILHQAIKRSPQPRIWHLYGQFFVSLLGGGTWCVIGVWQWLTYHPILIASGLCMTVGVLMHVTFKYSDWSKCAVVGAIPPVIALGIMAFLPPGENLNIGHRILLIFGFVGLIQYTFTIVRANIIRQNQLKEALRQASAANEAKSAFLANMSHEIRTPMNGVLGMADLLDGTELNTRQKEMVNLIQSSGDSLVRIIDDVLDISKIEAGHLRLTPDVFRLGELVHTVSATSELSARENNLSFSCKYDSDGPHYFYGDVLRIRQVIGNLVSNAIKFTPEGEVRLELHTEKTQTEDQYELYIQVCDTGPGLSEKAKATIFQPFMQVDNKMSRKFGGTGLGLSIAREIARAMGGDLTVESEPGKGACFTFHCPLQLAQAPVDDLKEYPADEGSKTNWARQLSILVAEDHPVNRRLIELMLVSLECEAVYVDDGQKAVDACAKKRFDLILMDIQMPGLDGMEALNAIRQNEELSGQTPTPVVALTANAMKHQVEGYRTAGFEGFLAKPFTQQDLVNAISSVVHAPTES